MRVVSTLLFVFFFSLSTFAQTPNSLQALRSSEVISLQFKTLPNAAKIADLTKQGIQLQHYLGNNTYQATVAKSADLNAAMQDFEISKSELRRSHAGIIEDIQAGNIPNHASTNQGTVDIAITFNTKMDKALIKNIIAAYNAQMIQAFPGGQIIVINVANDKVEKILNEPFVDNVEFKQDKVSVLNYENKSIQGAHYVHAASIPGMELDGSGVVIGIGDGGKLGENIDFDQAILSETNDYAPNFGIHGNHVTGTIGSRGILDPKQSGFAPAAGLLIEMSQNIIYKTQEYYEEYGMVLTNNSYGSGPDCETNGSYNYSSYTLDKQLYDMPHLMHVFAAGNFGKATCGEFPQGYKTVLKYYGSAKNVLTVGSVDENLRLADSSSRGPVKDGRIKPEICGVGDSVLSNGGNNDYVSMSGTSMAAPSVTGSLALMYQKYEQDNGEIARGDLMKAIICNTADDIGVAGPDYLTGFGLVNTYRAVKAIEEERYIVGALENSQKANYEITVPAGVEEAKFLLYWNDKEVTTNPDIALVNNLDIEIIAPDGEVILPWVLNHNSADVNLPATRKVDALNNIEQVTIQNPIAGEYTVVVKGTEIPFGPQAFAFTYEMNVEEVMLTYPAGKESLIPDERYSITWMANQSNENTFKLELSTDGGNTWDLIVGEIPADHRTYKWRTPEMVTQNAKIRVSMNDTSLTHSNEAVFHILGKPKSLSSIPVCSETIRLEWEEEDFADEYVVYMLKNGTMEIVGQTAQKHFDIEFDFEENKDYWFSVANKMNLGNVGERTNAIAVQANFAIACDRDNDGKLVDTRGMMNGREFTDISLDEKSSFGVIVKNNGNNELGNYDLSMRINEGGVLKEKCTGALESGEEREYEFKNTFDFSQVGTYAIDTWMSHPLDDLHYNDSIVGQFELKQLPNAPVRLPLAFDFEDTEDFYHHESQIGLANLTHFDFFKGQQVAESFTESNSNTNYLVLTNHQSQEQESSAYIMTLNMTEYDMSADISLNFSSKVKSTDLGKSAEIWLRGSDKDAWFKIMDLQNSVDWQKSGKISIREHLLAHYQVMSTSTQVKFALESEGTLAIDNIKLQMEDLNPVLEANVETMVNVYPNVVSSDFSIAIDNEIDTEVSIAIVNGNGQIVQEMNENLALGKNIFNYQAGYNLAPGMYFITIEFGGHTEVKKITKITQ